MHIKSRELTGRLEMRMRYLYGEYSCVCNICDLQARDSGMLLRGLVDLARCFGVFLGKLEGEMGIIGLFKNILVFVLALHHMRDMLHVR